MRRYEYSGNIAFNIMTKGQNKDGTAYTEEQIFRNNVAFLRFLERDERNIIDCLEQNISGITDNEYYFDITDVILTTKNGSINFNIFYTQEYDVFNDKVVPYIDEQGLKLQFETVLTDIFNEFFCMKTLHPDVLTENIEITIDYFNIPKIDALIRDYTVDKEEPVL